MTHDQLVGDIVEIIASDLRRWLDYCRLLSLRLKATVMETS